MADEPITTTTNITHTAEGGKKTSVTVTSTEIPSITIRRAKFSEIPAMAQCLARSFVDDVLFGQKIHPHRHQYPRQMAYYWQRRFERDFWDWSHVFVVAAVPAGNSWSADKIVGVAQWHRQGPTAYSAHGWGLNPYDPRNLLAVLGGVQSRVSAMMYTNHAADPAQEDIIERSYGFLDHVWTGDRAESWYLNFLGVDPDYQGMGAGRRLVKWGLDIAEKEGVSCSVIAAWKKDAFYQACGFKTCIGRAGDGEGNPLGPVKGGNIWFVDRVPSQQQQQQQQQQ